MQAYQSTILQIAKSEENAFPSLIFAQKSAHHHLERVFVVLFCHFKIDYPHLQVTKAITPFRLSYLLESRFESASSDLKAIHLYPLPKRALVLAGEPVFASDGNHNVFPPY